MTNILQTVARSLVGDFLTEYDEFDLDAEAEVVQRRADWLEPSW
jgi:hypothetical protein